MSGQSRVFQILIGAIIIVFCWALYAGVAMPSFRKGQQTSCASNIHQLALALQMYSSDYDSTLPPVAANKQSSWPRALRNYALQDKVQRRIDQGIGDVSSVKPFICPARAEKGYGYGLNFYLVGRLIDTNADPSKLILLAEASEITDENWWVNDSDLTWSYSRFQPYLCRQPLFSIHPSGGNIAYVDGHVHATKSGQLSIENWLPY